MFSALSAGLGKSAFSESSAASIEAAKVLYNYRARTMFPSRLTFLRQLVFAGRVLLMIVLSLSQCCVLLCLRQLFPQNHRTAWNLCNSVPAFALPRGLISAVVVSAGCSPAKTLVGDESFYRHNDVGPPLLPMSI